ncbi:MAG TPA: hypothetical protein VFL90_02000 [Methylomirabilota bacterium]|nr:hypothetical protein [Methylomirabilota bacterium]
MKTTILTLAVVMLVMLGAGSALAQQPAAPSTQPPAGGPMGGMHHGDTMQHGDMMDMCSMMMGRGMMSGGMMGPGMGMMGGRGMGMGMMGGGMMDPGMMEMMHADPKTLAQMLQLRGEIMKAVGDVLLKHAKTLESSAATK